MYLRELKKKSAGEVRSPVLVERSVALTFPLKSGLAAVRSMSKSQMSGEER